MLLRTDKEAANLLALSRLSVAVVCALTVPALYFGVMGSSLCSGCPDLILTSGLVSPFIFISVVFLALNYWISRTWHFRRLSVAQVTRSLAPAGTQLGAGFAGYVTGELH